jgi:PPOX class probable F420-dependent enzyme
MPKRSVPADYDELLRQRNPAVIATLDRDGRPNTLATWYLWEDGRLLVTIGAAQARLENVRRDPRVAFTILAEDDWFRHLSVRGRVVSLQEETGLADMDRLSQRYVGAPYADRESPRVSAWVEIDRWHAWPPRA